MGRQFLFRMLMTVLTVAAGLLVGGGSALYGAPRSAAPSLRLLATLHETTITRFPGQPLIGQLGTYVASVGGAFDLRIHPVAGDFDVRQVAPGRDGRAREVRQFPSGTVRALDEGLSSFFDISISDEKGKPVAGATLPFCPAGFNRGRVDDSGPDVGRYPTTCWNSPLTQGAVWGIDRGWSVAAPDGLGSLDLADGRYQARVAIDPRYVELLDIDPAKASAWVRLIVTTQTTPPPCLPDRPPCHCPPNQPCPLAGTASRPGPAAHARGQEGAVPTVAANASGLPDLVALPAWGLAARHDDQSNRDVLEFSATIWNAGRGPMVVEGFRRPGSDEMDAFQYFYRNGERTGRTPAGTLVFDSREGHQHWHFKDFARYRLLDTARHIVVESGKEAFCLAPTDAIDLTVQGADWNPGSTGLQTACGAQDAVWIREILQSGWGDSYSQTLPGQSFDITGVPNGTYLVEVTTNPSGRIQEQTTSNDTAYRTITLSGPPGARSVQAS